MHHGIKRKSPSQNVDDQLKQSKKPKESLPEEIEKEEEDFDIQDFVCPISYEVMKDPVVAADGHSYERAALEKWFEMTAFPAKSPLTNQPLAHQRLQSNTALKSAIEKYRQEVQVIERTYQQLEEEKQKHETLTITSHQRMDGLEKEIKAIDETKINLEKELQSLSEQNQITAGTYQNELGELIKEIAKLYSQAKEWALNISADELKTENKILSNELKVTPGFSSLYDEKPTFYGEIESQSCTFIEHKAQEDGSCGFHVLGATRKEVVNELLRDIDDKYAGEGDCQFLAEEIEAVLRSNIRGSIHIPESVKLADELKRSYEDYDHVVQDINIQLIALNPIFQALSAEALRLHLNTLPRETAQPYIEQLQKAKQELETAIADNDSKLQVLCRHRETYKQYVEKFLGGTGWLGYKSAMLFCRKKDYSLHVLRRVAKDSPQLEVAAQHVAIQPMNTIYMLHTQGFSHFNLLEKSNLPISSALLPPSTHYLLKGAVDLLAEISFFELEKALIKQDKAANRIAQFYLSYQIRKVEKLQCQLEVIQNSLQNHERDIKAAFESKEYGLVGTLGLSADVLKKQLEEISREIDRLKQLLLNGKPQQHFMEAVARLNALLIKNQHHVSNLLEVFTQKKLEQTSLREKSKSNRDSTL